MDTIAYACIYPYLEQPPPLSAWGVPVDQVYLDQVLPGHPRPVLQHLLQNCATLAPRAIVVRQWSDLGDSVQAIVDCVALWLQQEIEVFVLYSLGERGDRSSPPPHLPALPQRLTQLETLWTEADALYAQIRSRRLRAGHAQNRIQAMPPPGRAPYGYRRGRYRYALDRTTAPAVRGFFEHFLLYGSIRGAAKFLNKTYGKRISASTAQRWLAHPVYRGDCQYQDGHILRDTHTPIISREEAAQVDRLLRRNRRLPAKTASAQRSLAGLVTCATCGSKLIVSSVTARKSQRCYLYLRPMDCSQAQRCRAISYEAVLQKSIGAIVQALPQAVQRFSTTLPPSPKAAMLQQIQHKEAALHGLTELVDQGILDTPTAQLRAYTLRSEVAALQQHLSQLPPENLQAVARTLASEQFWQDLTESERRVYFREFIQTIQIIRQENAWDVAIQFVFEAPFPMADPACPNAPPNP